VYRNLVGMHNALEMQGLTHVSTLLIMTEPPKFFKTFRTATFATTL
jgi:hypothetical protein